MARLDIYNLVLKQASVKNTIGYYERQSAESNWIVYKPGHPLEKRTYDFVYYGDNWAEFEAYLKGAVRDKSIHTIEYDDGTKYRVVITSASIIEAGGQVNQVRGSFKVLVMDGYDLAVDEVNETIENRWG